MLVRSRRFTAQNACMAVLLTGLLAIGAPSMANDERSDTDAAAGQEIALMTLGQGFIDFGINMDAQKSVLRISGPRGYALTLRNQKPAAVTADLLMDAKPRREAAENPAIPEAWQALPDGSYLYELVLLGPDGSEKVKSGSFKVVNGQPMTEDEKAEPADSDDRQSSNYEPNWIERVASATLDFLVPSAHADTASNYIDVLDNSGDDKTDITLHNSANASSQNVAMFNDDGELKFGEGTAGNDAVLMTFSSALGKVGIHTETPQELLHIVSPLSQTTASMKIENSSNAYTLATGSNTGFRIRQSEPGSTTVFQIEPGAPTNSIHVASNGNVGLGTSSPSSALHMSGDLTLTDATPSITFDNTSGNSVKWTIGENSDDFRIRQSGGSGASTPFAIAEDGNVGIGTSGPAQSLHVRATDGSAGILVEETQAIATNDMFTMRNNGNPGFLLENTNQGTAWQFRLGGSGTTEQFTINKTSTSGPELSVLANGNIRIKGAYVSGSSRSLKQNLTKIRSSEILAKIGNLPVYEWSYRAAPGSRHIGPMAEDYYEIFGLAGNGKGLAATDVASIAVAGIQAIQAKAEKLVEENRTLNERLDSLEAALMAQ